MIDGELTPTLRSALDAQSIERLAMTYGPPEIITAYAEGQGNWKPGDGAPTIRPESPAEGQAIGRCAASRIRFGGIGLGSLHATSCGWCKWPLAELLRACDYAVWQSRYVISEWARWWCDPRKEGEKPKAYLRAPEKRVGAWDNPTYADFWASPVETRRRLIDRASGRSIEATP